MKETKFVSLKTLQIEIIDAVICFNNGMQIKRNCVEVTGILPVCNMEASLRKIREIRVRMYEENV